MKLLRKSPKFRWMDQIIWCSSFFYNFSIQRKKKFVKTRGEIIAAASTRSTWVLGCYVIRDHPEIMLIMEPWGFGWTDSEKVYLDWYLVVMFFTSYHKHSPIASLLIVILCKVYKILEVWQFFQGTCQKLFGCQTFIFSSDNYVQCTKYWNQIWYQSLL